jgi:hypothetical protein
MAVPVAALAVLLLLRVVLAVTVASLQVAAVEAAV